MADKNPKKQDEARRKLEQAVREQERRKLRARSKGRQDLWFGLGYFGLVGWAVAIPTVLGVFLGLWLDANFASSRSWTLTLLLAGLVLGLLNAWFWVQRQRIAIDKDREAVLEGEEQDEEKQEEGQ